MKKVSSLLLASALVLSLPALAEEKSTVEKVKESTSETYEDAKKGVKKGYRNVKDKTCEMINGKMECAVKKAGNTIKNGADEVKDKADDLTK